MIYSKSLVWFYMISGYKDISAFEDVRLFNVA